MKLSPKKPGQRGDSRGTRDLLVISLLAAGTAVAALIFDVNERFVDFVSRYERWEVDELPIVMAITGLSFAAISWRRWREATREIAAHAATREALEESELRFRIAFDEAPIGMALVAPDRGYVAVNRTLCEMVGYREGELLDRWPRTITHPDDVNNGREVWARLLSGETDRATFQKRYLRKDGQVVWASVDAVPVHDVEGDLTYAVVQILDTTEQKRAEETTRQLTEILEATTDLVVIMDRNGVFSYANRAAREFSEIGSAGEPAETSLLSVLTEEGQANLFEEVLPALRRDGIWSGELNLVRPSSSELPVSAVVLAHRDAQGRFRHFSSVVRDISERKEAERRLEELVKAKDEFVASVSHELRTPLTAVVGLAQELRDRGETFSAEESLEFVDIIASQSTEVGNIVEDLLVSARADIGKVSIFPRPMNLLAEVESTVGALDELEKERVEILGRRLLAYADPTRVRQILRNLLTNAVRYGGEHIQVEVGARDGVSVVSVKDDGEGIPPDEREDIFRPYHHGLSEQSQPASVGLGLTVSKQLARLMGGELTYRYEEAQSIFDLSLPRGENTGETLSQ